MCGEAACVDPSEAVHKMCGEEQYIAESILSGKSTESTSPCLSSFPFDSSDTSMYAALHLKPEGLLGIVGTGTFGTVFKATVPHTGETVALKKVFQDANFKNRELDILLLIANVRAHVNLIELKHHYFHVENDDARDCLDEYLYLVTDYMSCDLARLIRQYSERERLVPRLFAKLYMYQLARGLLFLHSMHICHRDLKPANVLLEPATNCIKICDFGSAKVLVEGAPNVSYMTSRFYRAPELIFESRFYTTAVDVWSFACVMAELLLGQALFQGDSSLDQLVEIVSVLGTPTKSEAHAMNPHRVELDCDSVKPMPLSEVFSESTPDDAMELMGKLLVYDPSKRPSALDTMCSEYFDDLRRPDFRLPKDRPVPDLFTFYPEELLVAGSRAPLLYSHASKQSSSVHSESSSPHEIEGTRLSTQPMHK